MPVITICSSAHFYQQAIAIQEQIEKHTGYTVIVPDTANEMKRTGDYDVSHYKTWFASPEDYDKKALLMRNHFDKIVAGDAVLVLNYEKNGMQNYIGGNVLMEMSIAFHLKKPIFVLNGAPEESPFKEEILGMQPVFLHGDISGIKNMMEREKK